MTRLRPHPATAVDDDCLPVVNGPVRKPFPLQPRHRALGASGWSDRQCGTIRNGTGPSVVGGTSGSYPSSTWSELSIRWMPRRLGPATHAPAEYPAYIKPFAIASGRAAPNPDAVIARASEGAAAQDPDQIEGFQPADEPLVAPEILAQVQLLGDVPESRQGAGLAVPIAQPGFPKHVQRVEDDARPGIPGARPQQLGTPPQTVRAQVDQDRTSHAPRLYHTP